MSPASNTSINVSGGEKIGGILGGATGTSVEMQQCASFAPVSSGARYIGGIMGYASEKTLVTIKDCGNYSILNCDAAEKVGGILGGSDGGRISISHSLALGAVSSSAESVGAIAGSLVKVNDNISLSNCYYYYDSDTSCSSPAAVGTGASDGQTAYVPNDTAEARMRQSSEDITSMKTAYLLNDKPFSTDTDKVWYQNTGIVTWNNKAAPYFEGDPVTYKPVINYDIQYGGAEFVYERGQWNPETHQYAGGQWKQENAADTQVSVKNNMETPIEASITVIQAHEIPDLNLPDDGITVSLENYISSSGEAVSEDGMCTLNQNEVLQAMVAVSGIPNENFDSTGTKQQLAAITVAVSILNEMSD